MGMGRTAEEPEDVGSTVSYRQASWFAEEAGAGASEAHPSPAASVCPT
jgi:hypothetical protein